MPDFKDYTGQRFGRLTVPGRAPNKGRYVHFFCHCDCGRETLVASSELATGKTKSCGCYKNDRIRAARTKHGRSGTPVYNIWCALKNRCYRPNNKDYHLYGGRGIRICERWLHSFETFLADMGERPSPKHSLDRIDNHADYSPENCRWATADQQANNTRRNRTLTYNGERLTISQWAQRLGIKSYTLYSRIYNYGWPLEKALTEPVAPVDRNQKITFNNLTLTLSEWSRRTDIPYQRLFQRLRKGWSIERALTEPVDITHRRRWPHHG